MVTSWDEMTEDGLKELYYLENLSDQEIADRYRVSVGKVRYRRNKWGISIKNQAYEELSREQGELFHRLNEQSRNRLLDREHIDGISKALTHYIFRNGPVEDFHSEGKLSQSDMKTLNKFMVNRLAGILTAVADGDWLKLELLFSFYQTYGISWDDAEPDREEMNIVYQHLIEHLDK